MIKKIIPIVLYLLLFFFDINAQELVISGKILNKKTTKSIPYSNIQIENTNIGTVTNKEGKFLLRIPNKYINTNIIFSNIGYKIKTKKIKTLKSGCIIFLQPEDEVIQEVIIIPDSTLLDLLKKAYKKIPENYPDKPTKLIGFYRETLRTRNYQYLYFAEGILEIYKSAYSFHSDIDQIKIIKSMINEFPGYDTINNVRFYGGPFLPNDLDVIKKHLDFINPQFFKRYNYSLNKITMFQNNKVYIIDFDTKNDSLNGNNKGKIFIDKRSLAYVAFKFQNTKRGIRQYNSKEFTPYRLKKRNYNVFYTKYKNKWYLKYIVYEREGFNNKFNSKLFNQSEFITTEIKTDTVKPIPYKNRVEYGDIFSVEAGKYYSDDYWSEYNILTQDTMLKNQIKPLYTTDESKKLLTMKITPPKVKFILKLIKRLSFGLGINYSPVNTIPGEYLLSYNTNSYNINVWDNIDSFEYLLTYYLDYNYCINKIWEINFNVNNIQTKKNYFEAYDFGFSKGLLINNHTNPIILRLSLLYSYNIFSRNFPVVSNNTEFNFANKKIDADKIQFSLGNKTIGIKPKISLEFNRKQRFWITTSFAYLFPVKSYDRLFLREKSGFFLNRKKTNINLINENTQLIINGISTTIAPTAITNYFFSIGIMLKF